jgi:uncharacterized protein YpiB (UPF0302 family)
MNGMFGMPFLPLLFNIMSDLHEIKSTPTKNNDLDEKTLKEKLKTLDEDIGHALDNNDKETFMKLSKEYARVKEML